ncbi:MAG: DNA repair exonuclease [Firmicutes bacterium]|nr:DNA repair exonuclease [Bacillota bacterium]
MQSVKIIHTADLHIDSPLTELKEVADIRRAEIIETFGKIIETAKEQAVDAIIISGDLFDNPRPSKQAVSYVCRKFASIPETNIFISLGNHDAQLNETFPDNVHIFGGDLTRLEFEKFDIYGVSFQTEYCDNAIGTDFIAYNPNKINLLALHCDMISKGQKSRYNPVTKEDLAATEVDYAALGHSHQFSDIKKIGNVSYAYCGIPEGRGFDELGSKGVIIGNIQKNNVDLKFLPLCKRQFVEIDVDITSCTDYEQICEMIIKRAGETENLCKINLQGEVEENLFLDTALLTDMLKDKFFYVKINNFTKVKVDINALSEEYSLKGLFVKNLLRQGGGENALRAGLAALMGEKVEFDDY